MVSFYPGPSQVYKEIPEYVKSAYKTGIINENHRSKNFMSLYKSTVKTMRKRLDIPDDFTIIFTSSATECWEIIAQSVVKSSSFHFYNGAFGEKWYQYTRKLQPLAIGYRFGQDVVLDSENIDLSGSDSAVICITQNETSNGTQVSNEQIRSFKDRYTDSLIAIDATSSMAGVCLDFNAADIWYASVQKCFGLPAGMGILILSPRAIQRAKEIGEYNHYNSLLFMYENALKWQTHYTPNILAIYLLQQTLRNGRNIHKVNKSLNKRLQTLIKLIHSSDGWELLCRNDKVRSTTVITIEGNPKKVKNLKEAARKAGLILGNGYGELAASTFRIANFPATTRADWKLLKDFLKKNL